MKSRDRTRLPVSGIYEYSALPGGRGQDGWKEKAEKSVVKKKSEEDA